MADSRTAVRPPPTGTAATGDDGAEAKIRRLEGVREQAMRKRANWLPVWEECADFVFPHREGYHNETPGQRRDQFIYDETAVTGVPRFASRLQLGFFPPQGDAFLLQPGPEVPKEFWTQDLAADLQEVGDYIHECLRNSNFASELHEGLQDLSMGTMTLLVQPGARPGDIEFTAVPATQHAILPGRGDDVGTWFRWHRKTLDQIKATWPKARPNREMAVAYRTQEATKAAGGKIEETDVYECVVCDYDMSGGAKHTYYLYVPAYKAVMLEYEYTKPGEVPFVTARWSKNASEVWGRGPLLQAMPAIKTLNLTVQLILENAELAIGGMWTYDDDGVFNPANIVIQPGMFVPKARGSEVRSLASDTRFDVAQMILADMRKNVRKALFIDELEKEGSTPISAEEVNQRMADTARDMGAVAGRLTREFLQPLVRRIVRILTDQGVLKMPEVDGRQVVVVPVSPLLRAQDAQDVEAAMRFVQQGAMLWGPQMATTLINPERGREWLGRKNGVDLRILNTQVELEERMKQIVGAAEATGAGPDLAGQALKATAGG